MPIDSRSTTVAANPPVTDDFPWTTSTTGHVAVNGAPTSGKVQFAGDQDHPLRRRVRVLDDGGLGGELQEDVGVGLCRVAVEDREAATRGQ